MSMIEVREVWQAMASCGAGLEISVQTLKDGSPLIKPIYLKWGRLGAYLTRSEAEALRDLLEAAIRVASGADL